ncbi:TIGR03943 family protein [Pleurocapsales cyanobacterium LEGE 06147]|nr:TIGR03943 family protein [Pleurocapsales cyanobacterium LEGE 06147]
MIFLFSVFSFSNGFSPKQRKKFAKINQWLDVFALLSWGILLLKYCFTGQLKLLIHPNFFWLVLATGIILLILSLTKGIACLTSNAEVGDKNDHIVLFPPGLGSIVLIVVALAGFAIAPNVLSSQAALQRGVAENLPLTRSEPQAFYTSIKPEERSLLDWVRTLNAYPEPDAYAGQQAKVKGFVVHLPQLPEDYLLISRFVITCCAVDAYPVGIPVKLATNRAVYPPDTWLTIEGEMISETLSLNREMMNETAQAERQLVLAAKSIEVIPTPADPYDY